jgi:hypothetical protein
VDTVALVPPESKAHAANLGPLAPEKRPSAVENAPSVPKLKGASLPRTANASTRQATHSTGGRGGASGSGETRASGGSIEYGAHGRPLLEAATPGHNAGREVSRQEPSLLRKPPTLLIKDWR